MKTEHWVDKCEVMYLEKIIQTMPNNVYFRIINYASVESWIQHWQLHDIVSACKQQSKKT